MSEPVCESMLEYVREYVVCVGACVERVSSRVCVSECVCARAQVCVYEHCVVSVSVVACVSVCVIPHISSTFFCLLDIGSLIGLELASGQVYQAGWPASLRDLPVSTSPDLTL